MRAALSDTTVLSNFAHVERPDLLQALFSPLFVPPSVLQELARGEELGSIPRCRWDWLEVAVLTSDEETLAAGFRQSLDAGESDGLAVAQSRGLMVLTDDRDARLLGKSLGLDVSGTLGCLRDLVQHSIIELPNADLLLTRMREQGYRSPVRSLRDLLLGVPAPGSGGVR